MIGLTESWESFMTGSQDDTFKNQVTELLKALTNQFKEEKFILPEGGYPKHVAEKI